MVRCAAGEIFEHKLQIAEAADEAASTLAHREHQGTPLSIDGSPALCSPRRSSAPRGCGWCSHICCPGTTLPLLQRDLHARPDEPRAWSSAWARCLADRVLVLRMKSIDESRERYRETLDISSRRANKALSFEGKYSPT